jgi:hypothetical protein
MEFMSQGVPVVASRTKIDAFYFEEGIVHFFQSGNREAMAEAMLDVINSNDLRESLARRGYDYVRRNGWDLKKREYMDLIDSLSTEIFNDVQTGDPQPSADTISGDMPQEMQTRPMTDPLVQEVNALTVRLEDSSSVSSLERR